MADSAAFTFVCIELEESTTLDKLEARGTIRLALKEAGLDARSVSSEQMTVLIEKILPGELTSRGVDDSGGICALLAQGVKSVQSDGGSATPESVFARLGN